MEHGHDPLSWLGIGSGTPRLASPEENIRDAVSTILGGAPSPIPGNMPPLVNMPQVMLPKPIMPHTGSGSDPSFGKVSATTHEGQKRNDTMDFISSVGSLVRGVKSKQDQKTTRDIEYDLNIIQAAASNPNDPHNQALLDELKQDKKRMGRLEKALGMNPFEGPQGVEQKTLQDYIAKTKQQASTGGQSTGGIPGAGSGGGPASSVPTGTMRDPGMTTLPQRGTTRVEPVPNSTGQPKMSPAMQNPMEIPGSAGMPQPGMIPAGGAMSNLLGHMPNTVQTNPQVMMLGELVKAGLIPKADASLEAYAKLTERMLTDDASLQRAMVTAESANNRAALRYLSVLKAIKERGQAAHEASQARVKSEQIRANASRENTKDRVAGAVLMTNTKAATAKEIATQHDKTTLQKTEIQAGEKAKQDKLNGLKKQGDAVNQDMNSLNTQLAAALNSKDTKAASKISDQLGKLLKKKTDLEAQMQDISDATGTDGKEVDDIQKMIDDLLSERDEDGGPGSTD